MSVNTSREAVERMAQRHVQSSIEWDNDAVTAATLRALLAERDAECDGRTLIEATLKAAEAERDAAFLRGWEAGRDACAQVCDARRMRANLLHKNTPAAVLAAWGWNTAADELALCAAEMRALTPPEAAP